MATYILLTRMDPTHIKDPTSYLSLNETVTQRIKHECPQVTWKANYAISGPYDYLDIFEAPDNEAAARVALIIRAAGHSTTEMWMATEWERFKSLLQEAGAKRASEEPNQDKQIDPVAEAHRESFPASDPPAWTG